MEEFFVTYDGKLNFYLSKNYHKNILGVHRTEKNTDTEDVIIGR